MYMVSNSISCKAFTQSLRNIEFLTWEGLHVCIVGFLGCHFIYHVIVVYQQNRRHMTSRMMTRNNFCIEPWLSYGL